MRIVLFFIITFFGRSFSQVTLSGTISDKKSGQPVPFANIGIVGKPVGTVADENGHFSFVITESQKSDSIRVSSIGYKSVSFFARVLLRGDTLILLEQVTLQLAEVVIRSKKLKHKTLGTTDYTKNNCSGFADIAGNWKGSETAVYIKNRKSVYIESFSFFVIQNKYADSLLFRLMFYERIPAKINGKTDENEHWVGATFLKKPIIFKLGIKQGEFTLPLQDYNIETSRDLFISLECLMDEMEISKFCYAGSINVPSYFKVKAFSNWHKTHGTGSRKGGGGGDFNVKVSYSD